MIRSIASECQNMSIMSDMAKVDAYYHPEKHKFIGVNIDPSSFVRADGSLDIDAFVSEIMAWYEATMKKVDADKAATEGKADG
jgi:hypothetical protein